MPGPFEQLQRAWQAAFPQPRSDFELLLTMWRQSRGGFLLMGLLLWALALAWLSVDLIPHEEQGEHLGVVLLWSLAGVMLGIVLARVLPFPRAWSYLPIDDQLGDEEIGPWTRARLRPAAAKLDIPRVTWPVVAGECWVLATLAAWMVGTGRSLLTPVTPAAFHVFLAVWVLVGSAGGTMCLCAAFHFNHLRRHWSARPHEASALLSRT